MTPSPPSERTADEILAERLVDEALDGMALPGHLRKILRATMIGELVATAEGRAELRRAAPDPNVSSSAEVDKAGALRSDGATPRARRGGGKP